MNLKYFIIKGKKKYSSIYLRFWDSKRVDQKTSTGFSILPSDWSSPKQRVKPNSTAKNADFINDKLTKLETFIVDSYNDDYNSNKTISKTWLKESVNRYFKRVTSNESHKTYFVDWIKQYVEKAPKRMFKGNLLKQRSLNNYTATLNKIEAFEQHNNVKLRLEDIDLKFHGDFIHYCRNEEKLNNNTIGSIISRLKTFCRNIELEGLPINPQFKHKDFSSPTNETVATYLSDKEIALIYNHDFSGSERLNNARDLFIIGLRTGLRVSDFLRISKSNIHGSVINITTKKNPQNLTIPIHPQFQKILDKRDGQFPKPISDQKFNLYIKEICALVKINKPTHGSKTNPETNRKEIGVYPKYEVIASHTCRRSFATNLFLAGFENSVIMKATGHKSLKQFLKYIKASNDEHIEKINEYWEKQIQTSESEPTDTHTEDSGKTANT